MNRFVVMLALLLIACGAWAEESAAEKAGETVKKGVGATERMVKKGTEATVEGLKDAGEWIGKKLQEGGEKLEKASK